MVVAETIIAIDFVPFYPPGLFPQWTTAIYDFYVNNYNDPLYVKDPPFFQLFVVMEALYAVPLSLWAIRGFIQGVSLSSPPTLMHLL